MIPTNIYNELKKYEAAGNYIPSIKPRVYIAGPMRGYENLNFNAFFEAEEKLKEKGYIVINPARNPLGLIPEEYMELDLTLLNICDYIYMLDGWEESYGAVTEHHVAKSFGKVILYEGDEVGFGTEEDLFNEYVTQENDCYVLREQGVFNTEIDEKTIKGDVIITFNVPFDPVIKPFDGCFVFAIGDPSEEQSNQHYDHLIDDLGFDEVFIPEYDIGGDKQGIKDSDYIYRYNNWEDVAYNHFLVYYAKSIGKLILDE